MHNPKEQIVATITIYAFGSINVSNVLEGMGECTQEQAQHVVDLLEGSDPVSMSGLPEGFHPCYNTFADVFVLDLHGHDFAIVELEENPDWYRGSDEEKFILPTDGSAYRYHG